MGRKRIEIDPQKVEQLAAQGLGPTQIARALGISWDTLDRNRRRRKSVEEAIQVGHAKGLAKVSNSLFNSANDGNVTAQIFYLKNRDGDRWADKVQTEHSLSIGNALDLARLRASSTSKAQAKTIKAERVHSKGISYTGQNDKKSLEPPKDA